jgi:hypothetical protein
LSHSKTEPNNLNTSLSNTPRRSKERRFF